MASGAALGMLCQQQERGDLEKASLDRTFAVTVNVQPGGDLLVRLQTDRGPPFAAFAATYGGQ